MTPPARGGVFIFIVAVLFLLSGMSALIYEIAWTRMLVIVFGVSAAAMSTVLAAFMGGLALGSAAFGRIADRTARPLRLYAWLELGVGLSAILLPFALQQLDGVSALAYRLLEDWPAIFGAVRFGLTALVLLVPTTLMGATLPVISRWVLRDATHVGRQVGRFYALNTIGAVVGTIVAAFVLLEGLGVQATVWVAAGVNVLIGLVALAVDARLERPSESERAAAAYLLHAEVCSDAPAAAAPCAPYPTLLLRMIFWGFGLSGFVALGYEVIWSRLLAVSLNLTTSQSLSLVLVGFLTGLALGGALGAWLADRWRDPAAAFGVIAGLIGVAGLASLVVLTATPQIVDALGSFSGWSGHLLRKLAATLAVTLLPTVLMGALFPLAARIHAVNAASLGRRVGNVYAVNTCGALLGAVAAGFVFLPALGSARSLVLLGWINGCLGLLVIALNSRMPTLTRVTLFVLLAAPLVSLSLIPAPAPLDRLAAAEGTTLLHHDEGAGGTVTVLEYEDGKRILRVNGAGEVPTDIDSIRTFRLLGNLPMLLHAGPPADVLVIAFGGGITLDAVAHHHPASIDCAELVPGVVRAAGWFAPWNHGVAERFDAARIRLIREDGRNHLARTPRHYDVIIADATHPGTADSWLLYTADFYRLARSRLRTGGIVAQWLPLHGLTAEDHRMILATFRQEFPHATLWLTPGYSVLLGTLEPLRVDMRVLRRRLAAGEVRDDLSEVDLGSPVAFLSALALDEQALAAYVASGANGPSLAINTDDRPRIGFRDRLRAGTGSGVPALMELLPYLVQHPGSWVAADADERRGLERRLRSRYHVLLADLALKLGDQPRATEQTLAAWRLDPGNRTAQRLKQALVRSVQP